MFLSKWPRFVNAGAILSMMLLLAGCAMDGPQSTFGLNGPVARAQMGLFAFIFWIGLGVFLIVLGLMVTALVKYRHRGDETGIPTQIHGNVALELTWTIIPAIILVIITIPTVRVIFSTEGFIHPGGEGDVHVRVTGYQWWWAFEYPELGVVTANELHIPVGKRIVLDLGTNDVIHSFWVPRLAGKRDLIPNQNNQLWIQADDPGIYVGQCAEYCLTAHAYMKFRVIAHEEQDYNNWVASFQNINPQLAAASTNSAGETLFRQKGCAACHAIRGVAAGQVGPDLTNFGIRTSLAAGILPNTPENLAAWLHNPQGVKPGNYMPNLGLSDSEVNTLVEYLHGLGRPSQTAQATLGR